MTYYAYIHVYSKIVYPLQDKALRRRGKPVINLNWLCNFKVSFLCFCWVNIENVNKSYEYYIRRVS